ncbi:MAG: response regulator, partial [Myxococcales bacterium]
GVEQLRTYLTGNDLETERDSLRQLERIVLDLNTRGVDPLRWQDALVSALHQSVQGVGFDAAQMERMRSHVERLRQLFAELASVVARKDQLRTVELANSLRVVGSAVVCARNFRALGRVLDAGLPSLDIRYCCVCTFTNVERTRARVAALYHPVVPKPHAQIQSAEQLWRSVPPTLPPGTGPSSLGEQSFAAAALLPPNSRPISGDLLAFPLMFGDEALGYVILDAPSDSERAWLLEGLSGHLSSAIYEIRRTEQLRVAREQAEEANSAKTTFVATMSHEVRTPLNAILGNLDLCLRTELTKEQRKQLLRVQTSSRALRSIIDDILDYSRIEANRVDLESVPFELESVLEQVISTCATDASRKNLEFVLDVDRRVPPRLFGDPLRLSQVLLNLVNNAIKFSTLGFVALRVSRVGNEDVSPIVVQFSVEDTGIGIGPDQIARIFHPFTQADNSMTRRYGGTGLGLTICQRLVELMGGELSVHSMIGSGSTFSFAVPFSSDTHGEVEPVDGRARVVLAIESSAQMAAFTRLLEDLGHQVIPVHTGTDALRAITEVADPDATTFLFADYRLSDMTGAQLLTKLRERALNPNLRLVLLVPYDSDCLLSGGWHTSAGESVLVKPPLRSSVERLLRSDAATRDSSAPPSPAATAQSLSGRRILVVQDSEMSRELVVDILSLSGAEVHTAADGEEAIRRVFQEHFDLVLMDLHLPMVDGWAASRAIREQYVPTVLPILALSATSAPEDRSRCLEAGMNDFLRAPIGAVELVDAVRRWLSPQSTQNLSAVAPLPPTSGARIGSGSTQVLEVARALGRLGGNQALYRQLLRRFVQTHATASDDLARLFDNSDFAGAANLVHILVSAAGNIGATRLQYAAQALEVALRNAHVSRIIAARPRFDAEWLASLQAVQNTLERYPGTSQPPSATASVRLAPEHIEQLQKLLSEHDTAAVELVDRLRESFIGDPQTEHALRQLAHSVTAYDFDAAQLHLSELTSSLSRHNSGYDPEVE